jgi:hypothetical protein
MFFFFFFKGRKTKQLYWSSLGWLYTFLKILNSFIYSLLGGVFGKNSGGGGTQPFG